MRFMPFISNAASQPRTLPQLDKLPGSEIELVAPVRRNIVMLARYTFWIGTPTPTSITISLVVIRCLGFYFSCADRCGWRLTALWPLHGLSRFLCVSLTLQHLPRDMRLLARSDQFPLDNMSTEYLRDCYRN